MVIPKTHRQLENRKTDITLAGFAFQTSDWPHMQFEEAMDYVPLLSLLEAWCPSAAERQTVSVETPAALFRFV